MSWADKKTPSQRNWVPTHVDDPVAKARYRVAAAVIQERGHQKVPILREEVAQAGITVNQLPSGGLSQTRWETLIRAYALCDCRCPVEGCEPFLGADGVAVDAQTLQLLKPVATARGTAKVVRCEDGALLGTGLVEGLGTVSADSSVLIRPDNIVAHWLAGHQPQGLALLLRGTAGQVCCSLAPESSDAMYGPTWRCGRLPGGGRSRAAASISAGYRGLSRRLLLLSARAPATTSWCVVIRLGMRRPEVSSVSIGVQEVWPPSSTLTP